MSDMSQGPGWWIASDGRWYPPHLHPSVGVPEPHESPAAVPESPTEAPRRRRRASVAVAVTAVVALLIAVGAVIVFGGSPSASAQVVDAATSTLGTGTAHIALDVTVTVRGVTVDLSGSGVVDFTNNAASLRVNLPPATQEPPIKAVEVGGVIYESVPGLAQLVPGKSWFSIDISSLHEAAGANPSTASVGDNPAAMLKILAQQGNTVTPLGPSTQDGVTVNGYSVKMNAAAMMQRIKQAQLPAWMEQVVSQFKVGNAHLTVYVNGSGMLQGVVVDFAESSASTGAIDMNETLDFSDYGSPVSVVAPPAGQVVGYQQLLQTLGSQGLGDS